MADNNNEINTSENISPPEEKETPRVELPKEPQTIIKRGGVSFLTALLMSSCATIGGAYLALFAQSRPDIAKTYGFSQFLPQSSVDVAKLNDLQKEVSLLRADIDSISTAAAHNAANPQLRPNLPNAQANNQAPNTNPQAANPNQANPLAPQQNPNANNQQAMNPANAQKIQAEVNQATLAPMVAQMNGLSGRLTAIETRLAALDPTGTGGAIIASMQTDIATLKVTIEDLKTRVAQTPSPAITFSVISLAEAAGRNSSFIPEFEAVKAAMPNVPEVLALEPFAKTGVPTRGLLAQRFIGLQRTIEAQTIDPKKEGGIVGWLRSLLSSLVKVDVKADNNPNAPKAIMERAQIKMNSDDLQGAIDELTKIASPSNELNNWVNDARRRLELEARVSALRGAIERNAGVSAINQTPTQAPIQTAPAVAPKPAIIPSVAAPPANNNQTNAPNVKGNVQ